MKLNQKIAKRFLAVALSFAMVVTSLFVMPATANAASGATIGRYVSVKAGATKATTIRNLKSTQYAKVTVSGTAKSGITIKRGTAKVTSATKIQGTGKNIVLNVKNLNVAGKKYVLTVKTYNKKTNKLVSTYTAKSTLVVKATTGLKIDQETATVKAGETVTLKATKTPATSTQAITWTSSDKKVATVAKGVVTGVAAGTATITAKSGSKTVTCVVTVEAAEAKMINLEATGAKKLTVTLNTTAALTAKDFTVKKGSTTPNIADVTVDGTKVVISLGSKMTEGTYSVTFKDVTKEVSVKDEILTTFEIVGTNLAETARTTTGGVTTATASINFHVLNQYGERMVEPGTANASCTFGKATVDKAATLLADGEITVTDIPATLAIVGTVGKMVLVDSLTGINSTADITYAAAATTSELNVLGMYNKSTGKYVDMTADDSISNYVLVFEAKNQYGASLNKKKLLADSKNITITATPILGNVTIAGTTFTDANIETVTIGGKEYEAFTLSGVKDATKATSGSLNLTIVNNTKGMILNKSFTVNDGTYVKSVSISAKDGIYALEANEMNFDVVDANGNAITKFDYLDKLVKFTSNSGTFKWAKQTNGTAKLYFTPAPTGYEGGTNNKMSKPAVVSIESNKADYPTKLVVNTVTLNVFTARSVVAITGVTKSFVANCATVGTASDKAVKLGLSNLVIEDQYGNAMTATMHGYPKASDIYVILENDVATTVAFTAKGTDETPVALSGTGWNQNYTGKYLIPGLTAGSATLYVGLNNKMKKANADYSFKISALDPQIVTDIQIDSVNWGADWAVKTDAKTSGLTVDDIQVVGKVAGKTVVIPSDQYVITGDTYAPITTAEGYTAKTGKIEITVDSKEGSNSVTTVLTAEYTYSNKAGTLAYMCKNIAGTYTGTFDNVAKAGIVTSADLARGLYTEDQYGNMNAVMNQIKYTVTQTEGTTASIVHNGTNAVVVTGTGVCKFAVTAVCGEYEVTQTMSFDLTKDGIKTLDTAIKGLLGTEYDTVADAKKALQGTTGDVNATAGMDFITDVVVKTPWATKNVTFTVTYTDGTTADYTFTNVTAE